MAPLVNDLHVRRRATRANPRWNEVSSRLLSKTGAHLPRAAPVHPAAPGGPRPVRAGPAGDRRSRPRPRTAQHRPRSGGGADAVAGRGQLAAARPGSGLTVGSRSLYASLASAAERTPAELARAVAAWRQGGIEGLAVLEEPWAPRPDASTAPARSSSPPTCRPSALGATTSPTPAAMSNSAWAGAGCGMRTSRNRATTTGRSAAPPTSIRSAP